MKQLRSMKAELSINNMKLIANPMLRMNLEIEGSLVTVIFLGLDYDSGGICIPSLAQMRGGLKCLLATSSVLNTYPS